MSLKNKAGATAKNIEGKVQETIGNLTGNSDIQREGQEKQVEADIRNNIEEMKDEVHDDASSDHLGATAKNVEGKVQESYGDLTGDRETQLKGKGKQVEATVRHAVQDVKD